MSALSVLPLGVGDAFSARYYSSCLALQADGAWLLVDCPHPIRKMMHEAAAAAGTPLDIDRLAGVALTHLHADHASGLEGLGFYARFVVGRRMTLLAHPEIARTLWTGHLSAGMEWAVLEPGKPPSRRGLDDFFQMVPLSEVHAVQLGPFTVHCRRGLHSIPTTALRIEAGGRSLGYSADTAFDPALLDWLAGADLIIHETNPGAMHTPYQRLAALPAALRSKIRLIHYPDTFDLEASAIEPLRQGRPYSV